MIWKLSKLSSQYGCQLLPTVNNQNCKCADNINIIYIGPQIPPLDSERWFQKNLCCSDLLTHTTCYDSTLILLTCSKSNAVTWLWDPLYSYYACFDHKSCQLGLNVLLYYSDCLRGITIFHDSLYVSHSFQLWQMWSCGPSTGNVFRRSWWEPVSSSTRSIWSFWKGEYVE